MPYFHASQSKKLPGAGPEDRLRLLKLLLLDRLPSKVRETPLEQNPPGKKKKLLDNETIRKNSDWSLLRFICVVALFLDSDATFAFQVVW